MSAHTTTPWFLARDGEIPGFRRQRLEFGEHAGYELLDDPDSQLAIEHERLREALERLLSLSDRLDDTLKGCMLSEDTADAMDQARAALAGSAGAQPPSKKEDVEREQRRRGVREKENTARSEGAARGLPGLSARREREAVSAAITDRLALAQELATAALAGSEGAT